MLNFASICPHPPIIIPTIGSEDDLKKADKTIQGLKKLGVIFKNAGLETVIVISPHGPTEYSEFPLNISPILEGSFNAFGDYQSHFKFRNNLEIIEEIKNECRTNKIPYKLIDFPRLDHGTLVPLYYLVGQEIGIRIVPLAYSFLSNEVHFQFGKTIKSAMEKQKSRIGVIASGDFSHRLSYSAPAGYSPEGKIFDKTFIKLLEKNDIKGILNMDKELIEKAGECGYLSVLILLGIISEIKKAKFEIFSYEGPFGVGYLTANVKF